MVSISAYARRPIEKFKWGSFTALKVAQKTLNQLLVAALTPVL